MCVGIASLHDVGRVGAEHHQLAVRHVDDAHDAERDGQPDGDQHEHRAEAEAEEQRFDRRVEGSRPSRCCCSASLRPPSDRFVGFGERAVSALLDERGEPVADVRAEPARQRRRWPRGARPDRVPSRRPARGRSRSRVLNAGVGFDGSSRSRSSSTVGSSSDRSMSLTAASRTAASGLARANRASAVRSTRRSRLFVPILVSVVARRRCPRPASDTGSTSSNDARAPRRPILTMKTFWSALRTNSRSSRSAVQHRRVRAGARRRSAARRSLPCRAKLASRSSPRAAERTASSGGLRDASGRHARSSDDRSRASSSHRSRRPPAGLSLTCSSGPSTPWSSCCSSRTSASPSRLRCPCCRAGSRTTRRPAPCRWSSRRRRTGRRRAPRRCRPAW